MSTSRLAYDDAASLREMTGDARAVERRLDLPGQRGAERETLAVMVPRTAAPAIDERLAARAGDLALSLG